MSIVSAVLLTMGVDLKEVLIGLVKNPPWWAVDWWSSYVLVALGLWCIAWVFYRQTQAEIEKIRNPKFNVSVPRIVKYLQEESSWGIVENRHSSISPQAAILKINQEARDGAIQLDGRRQIDPLVRSLEGDWMQTWEPILRKFPDYWDYMQVSSKAAISMAENVEETEPIHITNMRAKSFPTFTQLRACWPEVFAVWSRAGWLARQRKRWRNGARKILKP